LLGIDRSLRRDVELAPFRDRLREDGNAGVARSVSRKFAFWGGCRAEARSYEAWANSRPMPSASANSLLGVLNSGYLFMSSDIEPPISRQMEPQQHWQGPGCPLRPAGAPCPS